MGNKSEDQEVIQTPAAPLTIGDGKHVTLPRSLYMVDVQAALFYLTDPDTRRMIIAMCSEAHTATTIASVIGMERSHVSKKIQRVTRCGIIRQVPATETEGVARGKFYVADVDLVELCCEFANKYINKGGIIKLHEQISSAESAKRSYNSRVSG